MNTSAARRALVVALIVLVGASASVATRVSADTFPPAIGPFSVAPGPQPNSYSLAWGTGDPPAGYVFDVQLKASGNTTWTNLASGTVARGETFTPTVLGPYELRARLRGIAGGPNSSWSSVTLRGDWPMFRYNQQHAGMKADPTIGASTASHLAVKWKVLGTAFKDFWSTPAVAFNTQLHKPLVFSATVAGTITARDLATGVPVWTRSNNGPIVSSPAVFGNTVYVGTEARNLLALDAATGALQCKLNLSGNVLSSPVVGRIDDSGPVVFFGDSGKQDGDAGHEWAVNGVGNSRGACTKRWVFDGWKNPGPDGQRTGSWSPPALINAGVVHPRLVFGSSDPDDSVYAVDARNGKLLWSFQSKITSNDDDVGAAPAISAPGVNGFRHGVVYVDGKDKIEYAIDLANGAKIWQFDLKQGSGGASANSQSGSALVGNRVVVPYARYVFSLDAVTGKQTWRSPAGAGSYFASPVVSGAPGDQVVIIGDASGVEHAYRFLDGTEVFQLKTGGSIYSSAAVAYGSVIFAADTGHLYALG